MKEGIFVKLLHPCLTQAWVCRFRSIYTLSHTCLVHTWSLPQAPCRRLLAVDPLGRSGPMCAGSDWATGRTPVPDCVDPGMAQGLCWEPSEAHGCEDGTSWCPALAQVPGSEDKYPGPLSSVANHPFGRNLVVASCVGMEKKKTQMVKAAVLVSEEKERCLSCWAGRIKKIIKHRMWY